MPKICMVETGENDLDKTGSQVWRHNRVVNFKYLQNNWSIK